MTRVVLSLLVLALLCLPSAAPELNAQAAPSGTGPQIVIETEKGTIVIQTFQDKAPRTVAHIVDLVKKNFYNALVQRYGFEDEAKKVQDLYLEGKREEAMAALSDELIDTVSLVGPKDKVKEQLAVFRDAGVHTLGVTPLAFDKAGRLEQLRLLAELNAA